MRGRKIDNEFVSDFILSCINTGHNSNDKIIELVNRKINAIDDKIKNINSLKEERSKLLDVIIKLDHNKKANKEKIFLPFYGVSYRKIAANIVDIINKETKINYSLLIDSDFIFTIKQLLMLNVLKIEKDLIMAGEKFENYMEFINK